MKARGQGANVRPSHTRGEPWRPTQEGCTACEYRAYQEHGGACRIRSIASFETGTFAGYSSGIPDRWTVSLLCFSDAPVVHPSFFKTSRPRLSFALLSSCLSIGSHDQRIHPFCACVPPLSRSHRSRVGRVLTRVNGNSRVTIQGYPDKLLWSDGPRLAP